MIGREGRSPTSRRDRAQRGGAEISDGTLSASVRGSDVFLAVSAVFEDTHLCKLAK